MSNNRYNNRGKAYSSKAFHNSKLMKYYVFVFFSKILYFLLIVISVLFINFSIKNKNFDIFVKESIIITSKPIYFFAELPFKAVYNFIHGVKNILFVGDINKSLVTENQILRAKLRKHNEILKENEDLKKMLNFKDNLKFDFDFVSAKVYSKSKSNLNQNMIINAGSDDGVFENTLVLSENGNVIGRVVGVSKKFSDILLLNDINSKIPARVGKYNERVIITGNNERYLEMLYFYSKTPIFNEGDLVYTSGDSDLIPDGLPIGKIRFRGDTPVIEMAEDINKLFDVIIIRLPAK